jgi:hypothetical protein
MSRMSCGSTACTKVSTFAHIILPSLELPSINNTLPWYMNLKALHLQLVIFRNLKQTSVADKFLKQFWSLNVIISSNFLLPSNNCTWFKNMLLVRGYDLNKWPLINNLKQILLRTNYDKILSWNVICGFMHPLNSCYPQTNAHG